MKKGLIFGVLIVVLVVLPLLSSCNGEETTSPATSPATSATASPSGSTGGGDWWDEFGEPQYGGTLTIRMATDSNDTPDPARWGSNCMPYWETLFARDWTVSRDVYDFQLEWAPVEYYEGVLADGWEYTDPLTVTVNIREGVYWPNEEPLNGREMTAYDVEYTYDRILGTGNGFTEPNMFYIASISNVERVVAVDDYTVEFRLKNDAYFSIYDVFGGGFFGISIHAPELVEGGYLDTFDTASAAGTGPFIMTECTPGTGKTYVRNPNYWGYDQRYPENQLPYADTLKVLTIPDTSTALAAMRSGQIDVMELMNTLSWQQAEALAKSNPDIQQSTWPSPGYALEMRVDREPFTDINVRQALQYAVDLDTIAQTHYGGLVSGDPEGLVSTRITGWALTYDEWPEELQAEYTYDPDKARALLAEAGYPDGFETNVWASSTQDIELLEIIKAYFMEIGVDMTISTQDFAGHSNFCSAGKHDQMSLWATSGTTRPPQNDIIQHITGNSYSFCDDPVYDEMVARALAATNEEEAKQLVIEADQYALQQHWQVNLYGTVSPITWQGWVKGNSGEWANGSLYGYYWSRWWIDESMK